MRILFLGTPDFAVNALESILKTHHEIIGVITQPDKRRNRGEVSFCPVKQCAVDNNLTVYQYESIRKEGVEDIKNLNPDVMVTCAYGQIISQEILDIPKHGVINIHASLLPKYRGSSPIQWCLINGEKKTGITIMRTALAVDSGDILLQKEIEILPDENAGQLFDRLAVLGGQAICEALALIESGNAIFVSQDESKATHYPMIKKEDGMIDWNMSDEDIFNKMRGFTPWPSAFTYLDDKLFKILKSKPAEYVPNIDSIKIGQIIVEGKKAFVRCGKGALELLEVQLEGKKAMDIATFMTSGKLKTGVKLGK